MSNEPSNAELERMIDEQGAEYLDKIDIQARVNKGGIFFAARTRTGAITSAPFGVYHTRCESPQPYSEHYSLESAVDEANRLNMELDK